MPSEGPIRAKRSRSFDQNPSEVAAIRRHAELLDQIHDSVVATDLDGVVTGWNKGAERLFGYSAAEAIGQHISFIYPPEEHDFLQRQVIAPLKELGRHQTEARMQRKSEDCFHAHLSLSLVRDANGAAVGMIGYSIDISAQKSAEAALRTRLRQQEAAAEFGQWVLAAPMSSRTTTIQLLLDQAVQVLVRTLEVDLAKVLELLPNGDRLLLRSGIGWAEGSVGQACVETERHSQAGYTLMAAAPVIVEDFNKEVRFTPPPLLREHGVVSGMSVIIPGKDVPYGVLGVHTRRRRKFMDNDANFLRAIANTLGLAIERYRIREELIQRGDRFRQITENIHEVLFLSDLQSGRMLYVNPAYEIVWGLTRESLYADGISWTDVVHPEDRPRVLNKLRDPASFDEEFRIIRSDGQCRWIRNRFLTVHDGHGKPNRRVGIAEDITAQKQAAEDARRLAQEHTARTAAETAVRARDQALAQVAHDLRNPLNVIVSSARLQLLKPLPQNQQRNLCEKIVSAADRMNRLIHDLLDVARMEAGRLVVNLAPLDVLMVITETCDSFRPLAEQRNIVLRNDVPATLPRVLADKDRLIQVLANLLDNALKFAASSGTVNVRADMVGPNVRISVADTGSGISAEEQSELFKPFWQGVPADRRGSGLGLAIVKGIVDAHGGQVWVESRLGVGTTVHFTLRSMPSEPFSP